MQASDYFKCFICMSRVKDASIYPCCTKLSCYDCVKRWLLESGSCPHCRMKLDLSKIIKCPWLDDVGNMLTLEESCSSNSSRSQEMSSIGCDLHDGNPLSYYCFDCETCICPDCAVLMDDHKDHDITKTCTLAKQRREESLINLLEVEDFCRDLRNLSDSCATEISQHRKRREEVILEMMVAFDQIKTDFIKRHQRSYSDLLSIKREIDFFHDLTEKELRNMEDTVHKANDIDLINGSLELGSATHNMGVSYSSIQNGLAKRFEEISRESKARCYNYLIPPYEEFQFEISDNGNHTESPILSEDFHTIGGNIWGLCVSPNGVDNNGWISIFAEYREGHILTEDTNYEFDLKLFLISAHDARRRISKNITSHMSMGMRMGSRWGFRKFFEKNLLISEGYLVDGKLKVGLAVRPRTVHQKCHELETFIKILKKRLGNEQEETKVVDDIDNRLELFELLNLQEKN